MKIEINERKVEKAMRSIAAAVSLVGAVLFICASYADPDVVTAEFPVPSMLNVLLAWNCCILGLLFITRETR